MSPPRCSAGPKQPLPQSFSSSPRATRTSCNRWCRCSTRSASAPSWCPTSQHAANLVKLSGNFLIASAIESVGEAVALVAKAGVDRQQYVDILTSTLFAAPAYQTYGGLIARQEFEPAGFAATLGLKDIRLVLAAAEGLQVPLPVASLLRDRLLTLVATGGGQLDWSAVATLADRDAGNAAISASDHSA